MLSIVLPLFDEARNVPSVVHGLVSALAGGEVQFEVVLVDNGSSDGTGDAVRHLAARDDRIVPHFLARNAGFGGGVLAGLARARGNTLGYMGGDGQIGPDCLLAVAVRQRSTWADLCMGRRVTRGDGAIRRFVSRGYNGLFRALFLCPVTDINGSPKIMTRAFYEAATLRSRDWFLDAEIVLKARVLKARIEQVPVEFGTRRAGASHVRFRTIGEFLANMARYRLSSKASWFRKCEARG